jgi:hypothetical protein
VVIAAATATTTATLFRAARGEEVCRRHLETLVPRGAKGASDTAIKRIMVSTVALDSTAIGTAESAVWRGLHDIGMIAGDDTHPLSSCGSMRAPGCSRRSSVEAVAGTHSLHPARAFNSNGSACRRSIKSASAGYSTSHSARSSHATASTGTSSMAAPCNTATCM